MASKEQIEAEIERLQKMLLTIRNGSFVQDQCLGRIAALRWVLEQEVK